MEEVPVEISGLSSRGRGIGSLPQSHSKGGAPVEVIGAGLGDTALVRLRKKKKGVFTSELLRILTPAETRVEPLCPHSPKCGGCAMQHIDYRAQLSVKEGQIRALFGKCAPIIGMDEPWRYRNKMEYTFSEDKKGNRYLGLIEAGTRGLVMNLHTCHLTPSWFIEALSAVRSFWEASKLTAFSPAKATGCLRTLTLREGKRTGEKMAMLTVSGGLKENHITQLKEALPGIALFIRVQVAVKGRPTQFFEMHVQGEKVIHEKMTVGGKEYTFAISPTAFFQPNTEQAEKMYGVAFSLLPDLGHVYDLYCGTGTIGMVLSAKAKSVVGVEINPYAVFDGRDNIENNGVENMHLFQGDVKEILKTMGDTPDTVVLDPPRSGLDAGAIEQVLALSPKNIIYISCNPLTQAENIRQLVGYRCKIVQPVDQFPHTPHIENITLLQK